MYSNMKFYENICNCFRVIQQDINRKLKSANCWQRTSLNNTHDHSIIKFAENSLYKFHISILFIFVVKTKAMHS